MSRGENFENEEKTSDRAKFSQHEPEDFCTSYEKTALFLYPMSRENKTARTFPTTNL